MTNLFWASAHKPTAQQLEEIECIYPGAELQYLPQELQEKINDCPPLRRDLIKLAQNVIKYIGKDAVIFQLGGSPAFQIIFGRETVEFYPDSMAFNAPLTIWNAFSKRESQDCPQEDGSVKKVSVFRHVRFECVYGKMPTRQMAEDLLRGRNNTDFKWAVNHLLSNPETNRIVQELVKFTYGNQFTEQEMWDGASNSWNAENPHTGDVVQIHGPTQ